MSTLSRRIYHWGDRLHQESLSVPSKLAFACSTQPWVEQALLWPRYQQAQQHHKNYRQNHRLTLAEDEQAIAAALDQTGLYVTHLDQLQLPHTEAMWRQGQAVTALLAELAQTPLYQGKHTLTATAQHFIDYPELFRWAIADKLLRIAEAYFGLPVAYDGPSFYYSIGDGSDRGPRRWHRDKEDWKMLKVAVYFTDVDENGGPFQCVLPEVNDFLLRQKNHHYRVFPHQEAPQLLPPSAVGSAWYHSCTGKAGTVVFCDTAHYFHRGCPPRTQDRSAIFYSYFSRRPKHPFFCGRSPLSQRQIHSLSEPVPAHLRSCLTWPQDLPLLARLIPKNRVRV